MFRVLPTAAFDARLRVHGPVLCCRSDLENVSLASRSKEQGQARMQTRCGLGIFFSIIEG